MVFVTGGTGLVGGYLLRQLLQKGEKVKALYRSRYPSLLTQEEIDAIEWIKGSLFDTVLLDEICSSVQEVYHCAGLVSFNPSKRNELMHVNVQGTANVVNACLEGGVRKLVHVSS
ncbi:MAG: NAD-dependent epimerase/dehydratase family protein, partial [Sphingobacteriales bacterium]